MHILGNVHVPLQQLLDPRSPGYRSKLCQGDSNSSWKIKGSFLLYLPAVLPLNLISFNSFNSLSLSAISSLSLEFYKYIPALKTMSKKCKNSYNLDQNLVQSYEFFGRWPRPV